jgi:tRNA pseudouridine13 synthase
LVIAGDALPPVDESIDFSGDGPEGPDSLSVEEEKGAEHVEAHVVTAEDAATERFSVRDVVLPLFGSSVILPTNSVGAYIRQFLLEQGVSDQEGGMKSCKRGAYRRLMEFPTDFNWRYVRYTDPNEDLQTTELRLSQSGSPAVVSAEAETPPSDVDPPLSAAVIEFNLAPGTYATMLLRELTKSSTESTYHMGLTQSAASSAAATVSLEEERNSGEVVSGLDDGPAAKRSRVDDNQL